MNVEFGKRLRRIRSDKGLSAEQVARDIEVAVSTYREWENGRAITGQPYIEMAKALGVSVYQLLGLEDQRRDEISSRLEDIEKLAKEVRGLL